MPHFKAFGMKNLQYEIKTCHKIHNKSTNTSYYLFKWNRRYYDKLRIAGKYLMSDFQKLFQVKLNPAIFRFLTWNLEKVVKPINKSIKFPSVLEPPTLPNKSNSKGAFLYLCVMRFHEIILEVPF